MRTFKYELTLGEAFLAALKKPESQRLAVHLRHIDELTNPQIAEIMELSVEAVESLTARGKRKLTKILQSHKSELGYSHG